MDNAVLADFLNVCTSYLYYTKHIIYLHFKIFVPEGHLDVCVSVGIVQATRLPGLQKLFFDLFLFLGPGLIL